MAGTYTLTKQTVFGNVRVFFYTVTNYTNAETLTVPGVRTILDVNPTVGTADKAVGISTTGAVITFATSADSYDGTMVVYAI